VNTPGSTDFDLDVLINKNFSSYDIIKFQYLVCFAYLFIFFTFFGDGSWRQAEA